MNMKLKEKKISRSVKISSVTMRNIEKVAKKEDRSEHYLMVKAIEEKYGK